MKSNFRLKSVHASIRGSPSIGSVNIIKQSGKDSQDKTFCLLNSCSDCKCDSECRCYDHCNCEKHCNCDCPKDCGWYGCKAYFGDSN